MSNPTNWGNNHLEPLLGVTMGDGSYTMGDSVATMGDAQANPLYAQPTAYARPAVAATAWTKA